MMQPFSKEDEYDYHHYCKEYWRPVILLRLDSVKTTLLSQVNVKSLFSTT